MAKDKPQARTFAGTQTVAGKRFLWHIPFFRKSLRGCSCLRTDNSLKISGKDQLDQLSVLDLKEKLTFAFLGILFLGKYLSLPSVG